MSVAVRSLKLPDGRVAKASTGREADVCAATPCQICGVSNVTISFSGISQCPAEICLPSPGTGKARVGLADTGNGALVCESVAAYGTSDPGIFACAFLFQAEPSSVLHPWCIGAVNPFYLRGAGVTLYASATQIFNAVVGRWAAAEMVYGCPGICGDCGCADTLPFSIFAGRATGLPMLLADFCAGASIAVSNALSCAHDVFVDSWFAHGGYGGSATVIAGP